MKVRHLVMAVAFAVLSVRATAQGGSAPPADALQRAAAAFAAGEWQSAADQYAAIAARFDTHALSRFRLGVALTHLGRYQDAEASLKRGEALGIPAAQAAYRLAQLYAVQHRTEDGIRELDRAVTNRIGLSAPALGADSLLAGLRAHPRWAAIVDASDAWARPCLHDPRAREFDFWIGDWDVRPTAAPTQNPPARNTVTLIDNGCVVHEHWVSPSGSEGQSFNLYDRSYGEWRQTWVDNSGGQHDYRGHLVDGNMRYVGDTPAPNGARGRVPTRLTFFHVSADSVRQFSESSTDGGKTWTPNYDFMYVRRP